MDALVMYDSVFGNTEKVAVAIGEGLATKLKTETKRFKDVEVNQIKDVKLFVVGSPTRAFRATPELVKFLKSLPPKSLEGVKIAGFDTRVSQEQIDSKFLTTMVKIFGYAAEPICKRLMKKGGSEIADPEGFYVGGTEGPLLDGELERAKEWGAKLAEHI